MSHVTIYLLFILSVGMALCNPLSQEDCSENVEVEATEAAKDISGEVNGNRIKLSRPCSRNVLKDVLSSSSRDDQEHKYPETAEDYGHASPDIMPTYQSDTSGNLEAIGVGVSNLRGVLYPHVHPKLLATYNTGYNVNSLPPVHSTYIHGLVPQEDLQRANYELDVLSSQNDMLTPEQVRSARIVNSQDEEILAQLQHDAIMSNILPSMPVPLPRYAAVAPASPGAVHSYAPASDGTPYIVVFPHGVGGGCAQLILLSCSPKITRGTLQQTAALNSGIATPVVESAAYRQPDDNPVSKSGDNKHNSSLKLNISKTSPI